MPHTNTTAKQPRLEKLQVQPDVQPAPGLQNRMPWLAGLAVSLLSLALYLITLSPTVNFIDSGELISVGVNAGISHPPGYPLYTLLIILGGALPFGDRAVGVNLISALAGALAVGLFYALVYEIISHHLQPPIPAAPATDSRATSSRAARRAGRSNGRTDNAARNERERAGSANTPTTSTYQPGVDGLAIGVSAGAALLLAVSYTFWDWATQAKMYTLHYAFVAGLLLIALRVRRAVRGAGLPGPLWPPRLWPTPARLLVLLAFGLGLTFTNHFMSVALLPSLAVLLFWPVPRAIEIKGRAARPDAPLWRWLLAYVPWLLVAGLAPLLLYLYLPLRSAQQPLLNWGSPSTWGDFWRHVTLWQSHTTIGTPQKGDFVAQTIERASLQLGPWLGVLALLLIFAGIARLARVSLPLLTATALLVLFTLVLTYNLEFAEVAAYSVPVYMMFILWAAVGLHWLLWNVPTFQSLPLSAAKGSNVPTSKTTGLALLASIPLVFALFAFVWNVGRTGHANDHLADAYIHNQFKNFAQNAVVISNNWYFESPSYYLQLVRHERQDVVVINRKLIQYPFYLDYLTRQYPDIMAAVKDIASPFGAIERRWVDGDPVDSKQVSILYFNLMHAFITQGLAAGRPVYLQWQNPGPEEAYIAARPGDFYYKQKYPNGAPNQQPNTGPGSILVSQTGKRVGGKFLDFWNNNGGQAVHGNPISDEFMETSDLDGKAYRVQYFEHAVFEYHPENKAPNDVILQNLPTHPEGLALRVDIQPFTGPPPDPQFDWRGILTDVVPKDDLAHYAIDDYPLALDRLATYARQTQHPTEAARFTAQAGQVRAALGLPNP